MCSSVNPGNCKELTNALISISDPDSFSGPAQAALTEPPGSLSAVLLKIIKFEVTVIEISACFSWVPDP